MATSTGPAATAAPAAPGASVAPTVNAFAHGGVINTINHPSPDDPENLYTIKQLEDLNPHASALVGMEPAVGGTQTRYEISWDYLIFKVTGYIDLTTKTIGVTVSVLGINLGTFSGSFDKGIGINVDLLLIKGKLTFVVEENTLYLVYDISVKPFSHYSGKDKIISW